MTKKLPVFFLFFLFFPSLLTYEVAYSQDRSEANASIIIKGKQGWRMISAPSPNTTFSDLFSNLWVQGVRGSDAALKEATLFYWDLGSGGGFTPVITMNDELKPGRGYLIYVFNDNKQATPGVQGNFPKVININKEENTDIVAIPVSARDFDESGTINNREGWNLLANPFETELSVKKVLDALRNINTNLNNHVYIWNPSANNGNGDFEVLNEDASIDPFQAFFIRYTEKGIDGRVTFNRNILKANTEYNFYDQSEWQNNQFKLLLGDGKKYDDYTVRFSPFGKLGEDRHDAYKLFSLKSQSINVFSTLGQGTKLAINVLPSVDQIKRTINIPLHYQLPQDGKYIFRWKKVDNLPKALDVFLNDTKTGAKINLRTRQKYSFTYFDNEKKEFNTNQQAIVLNQTKDIETKPRFNLILVFKKNKEEQTTEISKPVILSPNYPNPFRSRTEMSFKLKEPGSVTITIWNIVGQKVATIYDHRMMSDGKHSYYWKADSDLPSGIYICKLEAGGTVLIRKMTLIR